MKYFISVIALGLLTYWLLKPSPSALIDSPEPTQKDEVLAVKEIRTVSEEPLASKADVSAQTLEKKDGASDAASVTLLRAQHLQKFSEQVTSCTDIKNSLIVSPDRPSIDHVLVSVQTELGEPVIKSEDWSSMELLTPAGQKRIVKIETQYEVNEIVKKVKYFEVSGDQLKDIPLANEQAINPTDTFISSLEKDGTVVSRDKGERLFFQNGEEINYVEKNGEILSLEIIKMGRSLRCDNLGLPNFRCQCL